MPTVAIRPAAGGLHKKFARQRQGPFTTADCINARPYDPIEGRRRDSSRPGLEKYPFFPKVGIINVNLLASISVGGQDQNVPRTVSYGMNLGLPDAWENIGLMDTAGTGVMLADGRIFGRAWVRMPNAADRKFTQTFTARVFTDKTFIEDHQEGFQGTVDIELGVNTPVASDTQDWAIVRLTGRFVFSGGMTHQEISITVIRMRYDSPTGSDIIFNEEQDNGRIFDALYLKVHVDEVTEKAKVELELFQPDQHFAFSLGEVPIGDLWTLSDEPRFMGFTLKREFARTPAMSSFKLEYTETLSPVFPTPDHLIVAASSGTVTASSGDGSEPSVVPGTLDQRKRPLMAVEFLDEAQGVSSNGRERRVGPKLFIADYGNEFLAPGAVNVPKYYEPQTRNIVDWVVEDDENGSPKGSVPTGNHIMSSYSGRIYLAGDPPHAWQACAKNNAFDWQNDPLNLESAIILDAPDRPNVVGQPITAMIPYVDDYQFFATSNSIIRQTADIADGGIFVTASAEAGVVSSDAWAITPEDMLIFLDPERGLFGIAPGANSVPVAVSDDRLPRELKAVDPGQSNVNLVYDHLAVGVHIFIAGSDGIQFDHWWFDWRNKGFWPFRLTNEHEPHRVLNYQGVDPSKSGALLGCRDGWLRRFTDLSGNDDGKVFESRITYGPFILGGADHLDGSIEWLRASIEPEGAIVDFKVSTHNNAARALTNPKRQLSGVLGGVDANMIRKPVELSGVAGYVQLGSNNGTQWSVETLDMDVTKMAEATV